MKDKKSVLLYCDLIHTVEKLDDETAGKLFKHYLRYINDLDPETDNVLVDVTFEAIKQNLKRDLIKWEDKKQARVEAGRKGGLAKSSNAKQNVANLAVTVTGNGKVKGNVKDIKKDSDIAFDIFWDLYDKKNDKPKCLLKWKRLTEAEKSAIIDYLPAYKQSTPDKNFRKNPITFLNNRSWENEIITTKSLRPEHNVASEIDLHEKF